MEVVRHLGREARLGLVVTSVACFAVLIGLGLDLHTSQGPVAVNERANRLVFGHLLGVSVVPDWAARAYREIGQPVPFAFLVGAIVLGLLWRRDVCDAVVAGLGAPIAVLLADAVAKPIFDPTSGSAAAQFPSGHTTAMTALAVLLVIVAYRRRGTRGIVMSVPVAVWMSGSMTLSVIRLQEHVLTDAVGGVLLGIGTVTAVAAGVSAVAAVLARRDVVAPPAIARLSSVLGGMAPPGVERLSGAASPVSAPGRASAVVAGPDTASGGPRRAR